MPATHRCRNQHSDPVELASLQPAGFVEPPGGTTADRGRALLGIAAAALTIAVVLVGSFGSGRPDGPTPAPDSDPFAPIAEAPTITVSAGRPEQAALVEWAVDRFHQAGLAVPPVHVTVHDGFEGCEGNAGVYRPAWSGSTGCVGMAGVVLDLPDCCT